MNTRVFILEQNSITRAGLRACLATSADLSVSGEAAEPRAALELIQRTKPHVVLLGYARGEQETARLLRRLRQLRPKPAVLVLTARVDPQQAERLLSSGALGCVANDSEPASLLADIRRVARHEPVVTPPIREHLRGPKAEGAAAPTQDPSRILSEREMEVFTRTGEGLEAKEIAAQFSISPRTVDVHRVNIRNKLGIHGAHELMRFATLWLQQRPDVERMQTFSQKSSPLLLVEDDEVDILNVSRALRELGVDARLVVTRTAEEALTYLRTPANARPGLVLLDLKVPGMDGGEFLAIVRKDPSLRTLPVVVLTASQLEEDKLRLHSLGIAGYLAKPADPREFVRRLGLLAQYWSINEPPPPLVRSSGADPRAGNQPPPPPQVLARARTHAKAGRSPLPQAA